MNIKKLLFTMLCSLGIVALFAQTLAPNPDINNNQLELKFHEKNIKEQSELQKILKEQNLPEITYDKDGHIRQAMYVTPTGHIVYNTTYNIGAGRTLSTNKVWPGGVVGVSLTGAGLPNRLGVWDGGKVLVTHQEFGGRVTASDGASILSDHATHVAGTMIASGVNANAKGMSYAATLKSYDWNNDKAEMAQAAQNGMLISNHSYGTITGWYYNSQQGRWEWYGDRFVSTEKDYKFGFYDNNAADWDEIAQTYPFYLICKAAGNDRGDNKSGSAWYYSNGTVGSGTPPEADGGAIGYDCISTYATAKNILTVGAVNKIGGNTGNGWTKATDVVMSSFSGWGPTDDGRIKPDLVAPGVNLTSATNTGVTQYATMSGTSMATPAVSGSLLLVQQHYNNLKGSFMRSATLKGLAIHTADEAGPAEGPDYKHGWGLLNTASCVKFISDTNFNRLEERSISNGQVQTIQFNAEAGVPLRITICWTDKPGTPVKSNLLNNTTKMLVNDLDIQLTRKSDNQVFNPYVLNPAVPAAAATTGNNSRDNVEMIHLSDPQPGIYTLQISHKGMLSAQQPYSLLISNGVEKSVALLSVNKTIICPGQQITFTDGSTGGVMSRTWYFPGGTPSASTSPSQQVTYNAAGKYPVILKITTALGLDSVYKEDYITVGGLSLPFTETFETNSPTVTSWSIQNPDFGKTWEFINPVNGTSPGDRAMRITYSNYSSVGQRDGLISPPLSLSSHNQSYVTFQHAYTRYASASPSDSLVIYASTDCGVSWTRVASFGENGTGNFGTYGADKNFSSEAAFIPSSSADWCGSESVTQCKQVSLAAFDGQESVMLKFEGYNRYSNNLYIDNIEVNGSLLKPVAKFEMAKDTVCVGENVVMQDKSEHMPTSWLWNFAGAASVSSTVKNPVISYDTPGTYSVKLTVANASGSDSIEMNNYITVIEKPTQPNLNVIGSLALCTGDSVLLSTDSIGDVNWYVNDVFIAKDIQQMYVKTSGIYRVVKSNGMCEASSLANVLVSDKPVTPVITASVTASSLCPGAAITLTSSSMEGNQWYNNNIAIADATAPTYNATDSGSYTVIATPGGCASEPSLPKIYSLGERPAVSTISGPDNPNRDASVNYTVAGQPGYTYQWNLTKGSISSGNNTANITVKFITVDTATVSVVAKSTVSGCLSLPSIKQVSVKPAVGISEYELINAFAIYPVPAKDILNLQLESVQAHASNLKIVNILGQLVLEKTIEIAIGMQTHTINVSELQKGIYFIELESNNSRLIRKIMVE